MRRLIVALVALLALGSGWFIQSSSGELPYSAAVGAPYNYDGRNASGVLGLSSVERGSPDTYDQHACNDRELHGATASPTATLP